MGVGEMLQRGAVIAGIDLEVRLGKTTILHRGLHRGGDALAFAEGLDGDTRDGADIVHHFGDVVLRSGLVSGLVGRLYHE